MKDYVFLYKARGNWHTATNLVFIAKHQHCRAIPREVIETSSFESMSDFVYALSNDRDLTRELKDIIKEWEIY